VPFDDIKEMKKIGRNAVGQGLPEAKLKRSLPLLLVPDYIHWKGEVV
jgi:hypothetical protein